MDELIEARRAALHDVIDDAGHPSKVSAKYGSTPPHMSRLPQLIAQGSYAFRRGQSARDWPIRHLPLPPRIAALVPLQTIEPRGRHRNT